MLSIALFYGALLAALLMVLSIKVIRVRRRLKVALGDDNQAELQGAVRAQANFIEYVPITLILLALLELRETSVWVLHILGLMLLIGRCLHGLALNKASLAWRVRGMALTFLSLVGCIVVAIISLLLPYF